MNQRRPRTDYHNTDEGPDIARVELLESLEPGGSAAAKIVFFEASADGYEASNSVIRVFDPFGSTSGKREDRLWAIRRRDSDRWEVFAASKAIFVLENCEDASEILFVSSDLSHIVAIDDFFKSSPKTVVKIREVFGQPWKPEWGTICWKVRRPTEEDPSCREPICVAIAGVFGSCGKCKNPPCYRLVACDEVSPDIIANNEELGELFYQSIIEDADAVVELEGEASSCYVIAEEYSCTGAKTVTILNSLIGNCDPCGKCYELENCHDPDGEFFFTRTNLAAKVPGKTPADLVKDGQVFEFEGMTYRVVGFTECSEGNLRDMASAVPVDSCGNCYKLEACGSHPSLYTSAAENEDGDPLNLADRVGKGVLLDTGLCYTVREETDDTKCKQSAKVTILETYDAACCKIYEIKKCGEVTTKVVYTDLAGLGYAIDDVFELPTGTEGALECWEIISDAAVWSGSAEAIEPIGKSPSCDHCSGDKRFKLSAADCAKKDCDGSDSTDTPPADIITSGDLSAHIGEFSPIDGWCMEISEESDETAVTEGYDGFVPSKFYPTCEACDEAMRQGDDTEGPTITVPGCPELAEGVLRYKKHTVTLPPGSKVCTTSGEAGYCTIETGSCDDEEEMMMLAMRRIVQEPTFAAKFRSALSAVMEKQTLAKSNDRSEK